MIADWVLASVLGSALALISSFATVFVKDFIDRKQKDRDRTIKEIDNTTSEVYSPLFFYLFDVGTNLGRVSGLLEKLDEISLPKEDKNAIFRLLTKECESLESSSLRKLLVDNIGFVRPNEFRSDLFQFFQALSRFENQLKDFTKDGFGTDIPIDREWVKNMDYVAERFCDIIVNLEGYLEKLMKKRENIKLDLKYGTLIPNEDFKRMLELIYSKELSIVNKS